MPNPALVCDECGAAGAFEFGDTKLCLNCYAGKGSCCPEFGKDDLWTTHESARAAEAKAAPAEE
jgi:hypothetical protein